MRFSSVKICPILTIKISFLFLFFIHPNWSFSQYGRSITVVKTYTSDGTFTITDLADIPGFDPNSEIFAVAEVEVVIIGGGGGAGRGNSAGGGGGGQVRTETIILNFGASLGITIGQGGDGARQNGNNSNNGRVGGNTLVNLNSGATSIGYIASGGQRGDGNGNGGANGNGNAGGSANGNGQNAKGGGGGGAVGPGTNGSGNGSSSTGGNGGNGVFIASTGNSYGAGGGGNGRNGGNGGAGGGGNANPSGAGANALANSGSGGGAGIPPNTGGNGSGGKVIVQIIYRILPVEFSNFEVFFQENNRIGKLIWETAKEWENSHFEIERAIHDVQNWTTLAEVKGAGYSDGPVEYSFEDKNLPVSGGNIFYRLKQVDYSGDFTYSDTKAIQVAPMTGTTYWRVFPNPTSGDPINLEMIDTGHYNDEKITVRIISATGQFEIIDGTSQTQLSAQLTDRLKTKAAGIYTVEISWGAQREYHKVILRR